jgi:hypothetical protein
MRKGKKTTEKTRLHATQQPTYGPLPWLNAWWVARAWSWPKNRQAKREITGWKWNPATWKQNGKPFSIHYPVFMSRFVFIRLIQKCLIKSGNESDGSGLPLMKRLISSPLVFSFETSNSLSLSPLHSYEFQYIMWPFFLSRTIWQKYMSVSMTAMTFAS